MPAEGGFVAEFRVLGAVELRAGGRVLHLGPPKQRAVFAALVVDAGRPVRAETLVDRVWGENPPAEARNALYAHVMRVRRALGAAEREVRGEGGPRLRLERRADGYVLDIDPEHVDLHRFRRLAERARAAELSERDRAAILAEALGLWRGTPLTGLSGPWAEQVRQGCDRMYVDAVIAWARAELALGHPDEVIGRLHDLIGEHPLVEPLVEVQMRALHAAGRVAQALDAYAALRHRLVDELGVDPGPELRQLHRSILRGDLGQPATRTPAAVATIDVPAQLPPDVYGFTGRELELAQLDAAVAGSATQPTAAPVAALWGTAGVGKTALAVHWAHRVAGRFPDGQLYANLRGFDPAAPAMAPGEAVRGFLDAFGVPPARVPAGLDAQVGLYRSLLRGRRVLVVLDNARDAEQVRPLLPGSPGCVAVVTSRSQLQGLVAVDGARPIVLDLLPAADARALLGRRLGAARVAGEPEVVDEIVAACARLPLALAVVAARAAVHPEFPLSALAAELRETRGPLDAFVGGDAAADVRAVLSWSYRLLGAGAAGMFRLLALHPGPTVSAAVAASLAGVSVDEARTRLTELSRAHLVSQPAPGRFGFHDLLRAYAAELSETDDDAGERSAAARRMHDHYAHTSHQAARLLNPYVDLPAPADAAAGSLPEDLNDHAAAMAWFSAELPVLLAIITRADRSGFDDVAWELARNLENFLQRRRHWHDWAITQEAALRAAQRSGNLDRQASAHRGIARAQARLVRFDMSTEHYAHALRLYRKLDDIVGQAHTERNIAHTCGLRQEDAAALKHIRAALDLYRACGHRAGEANALNNVGWYHARLGEYGEALTHCQQALGMLEELGDRSGQGHAWDSIGYVRRHLGQYPEAVECYQRALGFLREIGDRDSEAESLAALGDTYHAAGDDAAARAAWEEAARILDQLDVPGHLQRV
jgi:DNA-binding SARP family transcriptional activator/tetratricopeptide (TPR) repeat protein